MAPAAERGSGSGGVEAAPAVTNARGFGNTRRATGTPSSGLARGLGEAIADAFRDERQLREMLERYGLTSLTRGDDTPQGQDTAALAAIVCARAAEHGLLGPLVLAARRSAPSNGRLWAIAETAGLLPRGLADVQDVQKTVLQDLRQHEVRAALTRLEARMCRVWTTGSRPVFATGFLVGPDLVLTAATLLADQRLVPGAAGAALLHVTFDAAVTDTEISMPGKDVRPAEEWLVANGGDDLGYLLVRLAEPVGLEPGADQGRRGWASLTSVPDPERNSGVATFRYDSRRALVFSASPTGIRERDASGTRLQYEIDGDGGGSGSPVFDHRLRLIAVHVARASGWLATLAARRLREGTPVDRLLDDLHRRGVTLLPMTMPS
jgi:hypothetical protein